VSLVLYLLIGLIILFLLRRGTLSGIIGGGGGGGNGGGGNGGGGGPVPPGTAFTFNVAGDFRGGEPARATADNLISDSPNVIFMCGDYAVNEGDADSWTSDIMSAVTDSGIPVYGTTGNHDNDDYLSTGFFQNTGWVWSVQYGNIAFVSADTVEESVSETQSLVEAAQADSTVAMIIIIMHESVFRGPNGDTGGSDADPAFHDVFTANSKVKFVIAGHSHNWAHYPFEGIDYIILQDGGQESGTDGAAALHCSADANGNVSCDMITNGGDTIGSVSVSP
jgi:predicted phosphodiesterase